MEVLESNNIALVGQLSREELQSLQPHLLRMEYPAERVLLRQGERGNTFYIIIEGQVEVSIEGETKIRIAALGSGDFFGEVSCLTGDPISATVTTMTKTVVMQMDRDGLLKLMDANRQFTRHMIDQLIKRVSKSNVRIQEEYSRTTMMVRSLQEEEEARYGELLGQSEAILHLRQEIERMVTGSAPVAILGEQGVGKGHIAGRLHYAGSQRKGPLLIFNALDFSWSEWEKKMRAARGGTIVLKNAHHVGTDLLQKTIRECQEETRLILTAIELPDSLGIQTLNVVPLRERRVDIPLLVREILRRAGVADPDTAISSEALRRLMLYPYLEGNIEELSKIVQEALVLAAGSTIRPEHLRFGGSKRSGDRPKLGLALGGGAVRGSAHVGVLKVLEEEGIPVDVIAGSSVGSLVGALYAAGVSVAEMERILPRLSWRKLVRPCWPREGFVDNAPLAKWLEKQINQRQIEELQLPFGAVATDAHTGAPVVLRSGSISEAVRASTAIPSLMKPISLGERTLSDGSLVHKVPVILARSLGADVVVAVDVGVPTFSSGPARHLLDSLMYSFDIMQERLAQDELELADVVIRPIAPVSGYSFKNAPAFFLKGEEEARKVLPQIRKSLIRAMEG